MTLSQLEYRLATWHKAAFPGGVDVWRTLGKAVAELGELADAIESEQSPYLIADEAADVVFCLFFLCMGLGVSLGHEIHEKLAIIEARLTDPNAGR